MSVSQFISRTKISSSILSLQYWLREKTYWRPSEFNEASLTGYLKSVQSILVIVWRNTSRVAFLATWVDIFVSDYCVSFVAVCWRSAHFIVTHPLISFFAGVWRMRRLPCIRLTELLIFNSFSILYLLPAQCLKHKKVIVKTVSQRNSCSRRCVFFPWT